MSDHPKISIISTVYNTGPYLRPAVESILAQTFTDFELLLVDDGRMTLPRWNAMPQETSSGGMPC